MKFPKIEDLAPEVQQDLQERKKQHEERLQALLQQSYDPEVGFFGPDSMTWKLYREPTILVGGMRALLLQLARPEVAAGVAQYSDFKKSKIMRAHRTFTTMIHFWFGEVDTAIHFSKRLHYMHSLIRGTVVRDTEDDKLIHPFCAADPALLFWVLATIIDTTIVGYELTVRSLSQTEKNRFFEESKIVAQLMGIPLEAYPKNLEAFYQRYYREQYNMLCVGRTGQEIVEALFLIPYPFRKITQCLASGLLPDHLRQAFRLPQGRRSRFAFRFLMKMMRLMAWLTPAVFRYAPHYHQAIYRIAKAKSQPTTLFGRLHHWIGQKFNFYFIYKQPSVKSH